MLLSFILSAGGGELQNGHETDQTLSRNLTYNLHLEEDTERQVTGNETEL